MFFAAVSAQDIQDARISSSRVVLSIMMVQCMASSTQAHSKSSWCDLSCLLHCILFQQGGLVPVDASDLTLLLVLAVEAECVSM